MLPALIAAGVTIAGGMMQNAANAKSDKNAAAQAHQQYLQQKEFAQSGIQWKVQDAEKAGIHPLYALGANTIAYSPQTVGSTPKDYSWVGNAGQNIGRAMDATRSNPARGAALALTNLQLEGLKLDNDYKRVQLASAISTVRQPGTGPGMPGTSTVPALVGMPGQGDSPQIEPPNIELTRKIAPTMRGQPHAEYGAGPEVMFTRTADGGYAPNIPQSLSESYESDDIGRWQWGWRNKYGPVGAGGTFAPPRMAIAHNREWYYNPFTGAYYTRPVTKKPRYKEWR